MAETQTSQFNERSDNAALKLKAEIGARTGQELPPRPVQVGPDGRPPAPPPPEGSYARMEYDQQQAALRAEQAQAAAHAQAAMQGQPTPQQVVGQQPPAGTPEQQSDGSVAPPLASGQPQQVSPEGQPPAPPLSEGANARIQQLIAQLRERDAQIAELSASRSELENVKGQVQQLLTERDSFLKSHLEELEPEQRAAVLAEARFQELLDRNNAALLERLQPQLSTLQQQNQQTEMERVAQRYPGFDMQIHPHLIDQLRAKHPTLTYEQAFKAVAEGDEAIPRDVATHVAVPPVVPAGNGAPLPRYMPEPQADPVDELRAFQQRTNELVRSSDAAEQRQGLRQMDQAILERLRGAQYKDKPRIFD